MGRKILVATRKGKRREKGEDREDGNGGANRNKNKNKNKGARWSKGHSCVSNPTTTRYREQVSSTFLHPVNTGNSLLTVKNLKNNRPPSLDDGDNEDNDTVLSSDVASLTISDNGMSILTSASSIRTVTSGWSQVSHNAFEKFLRKFKGDIVAHKDMLSILGAVSEVIGEAGGKKNETEFFATFMSLLSNCPSDQYHPVMSLVCIIIGKVSPPVLKLRFGDIYPRMGTILSYALENDDDQLTRTSIEAFTKLLKVQDTLNFEEDKVLEAVLYCVLKCSLHEKPRVRRKARQSIKSLIICFNEKKCSNTIPKIVIGWALDQIACYPMCESKVVADALTLIATCWSSGIQKISFLGAKKLFEAILRVMSSGDTSIMKIGLSYFVVVFQNDVTIPSDSRSKEDDQNSSSLTVKLLVALWELQPDWRNIDTFVIWLTCILLGIIRSDCKATRSYLPMIFEKINPVWLTNYGKRILRVMQEYLPHIINSDIETAVIDPCFQTLAKSYLIVPPNPHVLSITECVLEQLGPVNFTPSAREVFLQLIPLSESQGVGQVLGKFVKAFGVENLWSSTDSGTQWNLIVPLLNEHLSDASILFWKKEMLTQIARQSPRSIWLALTGFTRNPKDPENFPAELIGKVVIDKPELRLFALSALRQFIEWPQCKDITLKYSKNYLPLLFNLYVQEKSGKLHPGHSDAIGVTIQKYLLFCDDQFIAQLMETAFVKLKTAKEEEISPVCDIIAFLSLLCKDASLQEKVLNLVTSRFQNLEERKRLYRIMTFLAKNEHVTLENLSVIYKQLCDSKGETKSNAAAVRLDCVIILTSKNPTWQKVFLSEIILNLLSANAKAKKCATQYVNNYCATMRDEGKSVEEVVEAALPALSSPSTLLVSCTSYFLFLVYKEMKPPSPNFGILNIIFNNLKTLEDPIVWKYSLAFINLNLSLFKGQLGPIATFIGQIAGDSKYPRREINKVLARMIKVFGGPGLRALLPNSDEPKMKNRIRNLCKKLKKLKEEKTKSSKGEDESDDDNDDDNNEDEFGQIKSESRPLVMKEGLVDFLNPREITQALINEEQPTQEDEIQFKQSKDGKLIIGNVEDDSDDSDSDDDAGNIIRMDTADSIRMSRKRKSSASVASSKKSNRTTRTSKTSLSSSSSFKSGKNRKTGAAGSRSVILGKKKRQSSKSSNSGKSRSSMIRFK